MRRSFPTWASFLMALAPVLAACGGSLAPVDSSGNDGGSSGSPPSGVGGACSSQRPCVSGAYCDVGASCGTAGTCASMPDVCTDIGQPVCGCDGKTYGNPCTAAGAGVSVARLGSCLSVPPPPPPPTGQLFACGSILCDATTQYCQRQFNDTPPPTEYDTCLPLPPSCAHTSSCSCFPPSTPCVTAATCKQIPTAKGPVYGFEVSCPGG
jgi:hypothetical protein